MKHYSNIKTLLDGLEYSEITDNKKITYINLEVGFDIETTSTTTPTGDKVAFMYVWQFGIGLGNPIYYGREWWEFVELCELLESHFELSKNRRLVIYVHNLGYEFQFFRKYFQWENVFSISERKPIRALTAGGIEFRDSYTLSGYSLANTARNLARNKVEKLTGDLDYSLIRTHETPLTDAEIGYCRNDIQIILAYINEEIENNGNIGLIPMTNTGRVRKYVRDNCYYKNLDGKKAGKGKYVRYRRIMEDLTLTVDDYKQLKRAFMGGFTHANAKYSGKVLENVTSIDFTSSYPAVMVSEKFPMSRFRPFRVRTISELEGYCRKYAVIMDIKFHNIRARISHENYISESKCYELVKPTINNGRVHSAELLATTITETDLDIMKQAYEWDEVEIGACKFAYKAYLPKAIIGSILKLYQDKTELKDVEGYEVEYMLSKGMLNSIYGMSVTDVVKDEALYSDDWETIPADLETEIAKYNDSRNRFLFYAWGIWITAYARRNLWTGIIAIGDDYVYSDTDSLKLLNYEKHTDYIKWFDDQIIEKMEAVCDYYKFDKKLLNPKTVEGIPKMLGVWDYEGTYSRFKTLGAKRYLLEENGKLSLTVAGLSKQNGVNYMLRKCNNDHMEVFNMFNDSLYIPSSETGKNTHTYIDHEIEIGVTDYLGKTTYVKTLSGVHLEECDFTLSIAKQYKDFLNQLAKGYIYKGLSFI